VMDNWPDWWTQRKRWQLGTLQVLKEYGWRSETREMIIRQVLIYVVMIATPLTAAYLIWSFLLFGIQGINPLHAPLYLAGIGIVVLEQAWQARKAGGKPVAATLAIGPDLLYSIARQFVYIKAAYLFIRAKATNWGAGTSL
jgi:cellulose synthase/poly-beta-1,6-N-acetylglucosamine synthase-like glycosyltransferase